MSRLPYILAFALLFAGVAWLRGGDVPDPPPVVARAETRFPERTPADRPETRRTADRAADAKAAARKTEEPRTFTTSGSLRKVCIHYEAYNQGAFSVYLKEYDEKEGWYDVGPFNGVSSRSVEQYRPEWHSRVTIRGVPATLTDVARLIEGELYLEAAVTWEDTADGKYIKKVNFYGNRDDQTKAVLQQPVYQYAAPVVAAPAPFTVSGQVQPTILTTPATPAAAPSTSFPAGWAGGTRTPAVRVGRFGITSGDGCLTGG